MNSDNALKIVKEYEETFKEIAKLMKENYYDQSALKT